jgi:ABC-type transport system involved in multi-copper enzyme maturation permease subunit
MKIRAIALNTFGSLVRNKLIILFCAGFGCLVLLMLSPMMMAKSMGKTMSQSQVQSLVLGEVSAIMGLVSGFGSLLAAWAAADSVAGEVRSGTILAVLARPVRRWEFLLGKYLGVQLLMVVYVFCNLAMSYLLAWIAGQNVQSSPLLLIIYPLARYAIYSAIAMLLVTVMHPMVAFGIVLVIAVLTGMVEPSPNPPAFLPAWLQSGLYVVLPSTGLLSETRFLTITHADLRPVAFSSHLTALAYGLDYALVCFLLAVWAFRRRSLARD